MMRAVIDTNVFVSALLSRRGASFLVLSLVDKGIFSFSLSVPLVIEYEDAAKRVLSQTALTEGDLGDILDYLCQVGEQQQIYYLWRPFLRDPRDDMVLELAVAAECQTIVTFNTRDFVGSERFGIEAVTPHQFLQRIGQLP